MTATDATNNNPITLSGGGSGAQTLTLDDANKMTATPTNKDGNAKPSGGGSLAFAGALASHYIGDDTEAYISPAAGTLSVTATDGAGSGVKVHAASANTAPVTADGSTVKAKDSSDGVAIAIGIDIATITTHAYLGGTINFSGPAVTVESTMTLTGDGSASKDSYVTTATSGLGDASKLGIAGSLTGNVISLTRTADIAAGATNAAGNRNIDLTSAPDSTRTPNARPYH